MHNKGNMIYLAMNGENKKACQRIPENHPRVIQI